MEWFDSCLFKNAAGRFLKGTIPDKKWFTSLMMVFVSFVAAVFMTQILFRVYFK